MRHLRLLAVVMPVGALAAGASFAQPRTLLVPGQYRTIQLAIQAARASDTVLVAPGRYLERIDFLGKAITVRGRDGAAKTTIDGNRQGSVVRITNVPGGARLEGFTITHGTGELSGLSGYGGGIYIAGASPVIRQNVITDNYARTLPLTGKAYGGGIYVGSGAPLIEENTITRNSASSGWGGGILCRTKCTIRSNVIADNRAGNGAGISVSAGATIELNRITRNLAYGGRYHPTGEGGGIDCSGPATIRANCIVANQVLVMGYADAGGGIFVGNAAPRIEGNLIAGNRAGDGGGVYATGSTGGPLLTGNVIDSNVAQFSRSSSGGGGVHARAATLLNNVVSRNQCSGRGGGLLLHATPGALINNTFFGNTAARTGGALSFQGTTAPVIVNAVFWNDTAPGGPEIDAPSATPKVTYSDVKGGWIGTGNLNVDPKLVDAANGDGHLRADSPCRGRGDPTVSGLPATDFEGDPRTAGGKVDIGADAFAPHLYHLGAPTPATTVRVRVVVPAGRSAIWAVSLVPDVLQPPLPLPGYGALYLKPPLVMVPLGTAPPSGSLGLDIALPPSFPAPTSYPAQALFFDPSTSAFLLSNLDRLHVR